MTAELSIARLILEASFVVQLVMAVLVAMSVYSWMIIVKKRLALGVASRRAHRFEDEFWSGVELTGLDARIGEKRGEPVGLEAIFHAGFQEFMRFRHHPGADAKALVEAVQRAMTAALAREEEDLEQDLTALATIASSAPYIGLFGTVWGIMNAFIALEGVRQVALSQVAPGIAEALIATAIGLFAAIPAVIAYNRYLASAQRLANRYEMFIAEFSNILQRQSYQLQDQRRGAAAGF
ncbi:MAG: protein TolQ [Candidatus Competibacterales bacterium]